jgi:hypothetical protein
VLSVIEQEPITKDPDLTDENRVAHIVWPKEKVTEAYVLGFPVEALCGHMFVPTRDPKRYPVCQACLDIWKEMGREEGTWSAS